MSGTKDGGIQLRETMIVRHGSEEAWKQHMKAIARKGGQNGHTGGFYNNRELASRAGSIGGAISKRLKKGVVDV